MSSVKFSIILPCFNVPHLEENILEVKKIVQTITQDYEIIIVNDGNKEFPEIKQNNHIKVITFKENRGKGEALLAGFELAKGEIICFLDADLQIPPILLKSYYEIMKGNRNLDIMIGSKRHHNSQIRYPFIRRLYSWGYQVLNKILFGLLVLDTQVGIKFFKKEIIDDILKSLTVKRFAIDLEILVSANEKGYKILEAPVQIKESFSSTVNIWSIFQVLQDTLGIWYRKKFKKTYRKEVNKNGNKRHTE